MAIILQHYLMHNNSKKACQALLSWCVVHQWCFTNGLTNSKLTRTCCLYLSVLLIFFHIFSRCHYQQPRPPFNQQRSNDVGGDPNIRYYHSYWKLQSTEALIIHSLVPECDHWNFQLNNFWLESLDYRYYKVHVNSYSASLRPDGSVMIIIANVDPKTLGVANLMGAYSWVNTVGHTEGTMSWRWIKPKGGLPIEKLPQPQTQVVQFADIKNMVLKDKKII